MGGKNKFNEPDFIIKDFGIGNDGNPFLAVGRTAGGTIPQKENSGWICIRVCNKQWYIFSFSRLVVSSMAYTRVDIG